MSGRAPRARYRGDPAPRRAADGSVAQPRQRRRSQGPLGAAVPGRSSRRAPRQGTGRARALRPLRQRGRTRGLTGSPCSHRSAALNTQNCSPEPTMGATSSTSRNHCLGLIRTFIAKQYFISFSKTLSVVDAICEIFLLAKKSQIFCLTSLFLSLEFRFNVVNVDGKFSKGQCCISKFYPNQKYCK